MLSSCAFQGVDHNRDYEHNVPTDSGYVEGTGDNTERFLKSFLASAENGVSVVLDDVECQLGKNYNNILKIKEPYKARGEFILKGLSLHQLEFNLDIPIDYNGLTRGLRLTMAEQSLYFSIYCMDETADYDVKYKVSVAPYDARDPETGLSVDPLTGGVYQYYYGDLDWVIDDIIESLTGEHLVIDDESDKDGFVIDTSAVLDSLEAIEEGSIDNKPYFVWNLPLGNKTISLGLSADPLTYEWTGVDFPSKTVGGFYDLSSDTRIKASASIKTNDVHITAPNDADAYTDVVDSMSLIHKVIKYANAQKFSVVTRGRGLALKHKENDFEGDGVFFNKTSINEEAYLSLRADIDVTDNKLQDVYADIDYEFDGFHQIINGMINGSATDAFDEVYAAINDLQKAKTSKTVLDSLVGALNSMLNKENKPKKDKDTTSGGLSSLGGALSDAINAIKSSAGVKNLENENYEDILKAITVFKAGSDFIVITLDLTVLGMSGTVTLHLTGDESDPSVGYIRFDNVEVYPFSLNGEIDVIPYERTPMSDEEKAQYKELRHLESMSDQFLKIADTKEVQLGLNGYVLTRDTVSCATNTVVGNKTNVPHYQGFTFGGDIGFNGNNKTATGALTITDRKEDYVNDHHLSFDITGTEPRDEDGNPTQSDEFVYTSGDPSTNWMLFDYNSRNDSSPKEENRTEPDKKDGLKGRFAMHSVFGMLDVVKTLFKSGDPRLDRIIALIVNLFIDSVIGDLITGQYFKVLGSDLITAITFGDRQDIFELPDTIIGGEGAMKITVNYANDVTREDGRVVGGDIESLELEMAIGVSDIYAKIDILDYKMQEMNWPNISADDLAKFSNFSSLKTLAEYGVNMFLAGDKVYGADGRSVIRSAYSIVGSAKVDLPVLSDINISFRVYVRVEGADIRIAAYIVLPINGLMNSRGVFESGTRYVNLFFHTSGNDDGTFLIDRWDDYGNGSRQTNEDLHFQTRLTAEGFNEHLVDYITKDMFGLNDTVLGMINNSSGSSSGGQSLHGEDLIKGLTFNNDSNTPVWNLDLSTAALLHSNLIGDIKLAVGGTYAGGKKLLNHVWTREPVSILGIIDATLDLEIKNFTPDYYYCWDEDVTKLPYEIKHETQRVLFITTHYYTTLFQTYGNREYYEKNFMTVHDDGSITLASGFAKLPINPTPSSHV